MMKRTPSRSFLWKGKNKTGKLVSGCSSAANSTLLKLELRRQGIIPIKIRNATAFCWQRKRPAAKDITYFTRQLATLIIAAIPLVQALEIIARGQTNIALNHLYLQIKIALEQGLSFSAALSKYPKYFSELYCHLVQVGEQSGSLDIILARIADHKEKTENIKAKIKKALYYPVTVIIVAIIVTSLLLIWIVPQFQQLYQSFGADLPTLTLLIMRLSHSLQQLGWLLLIIIGAIIGLLLFAKQKIAKFALFIDRFILQLPIGGDILTKAIIARFTRTLATTYAAGLPIVTALATVEKAAGNLYYSQALADIREQVAGGQPLHHCLQLSSLFPTMVIQMIAIGEESGSLEHMLTKIADFYETEVHDAVNTLSSLLEPMIMLVLGLLIGSIVIAMYLPLFKLGSIV